jgi:hypothetical protein
VAASQGDKLTLALMAAIALGLLVVLIAEFTRGPMRSATRGSSQIPASVHGTAVDSSHAAPAVTHPTSAPVRRSLAGVVLNG